MTAIGQGRDAARRRTGRWWGSLVAFPLVAVAACGDIEDASLCTAFEEYLGVRAEVLALQAQLETDPSVATAEEATELAERYVDAVLRLEQTADGRYGQEIDTLEQAARAVLLTLTSVQDDADFDTWGPLIEDDLELAQDAAVSVVDAIGPSCITETSAT